MAVIPGNSWLVFTSWGPTEIPWEPENLAIAGGVGAAAMAAWDECYRLEREYRRHRRAALFALSQGGSRDVLWPTLLPSEQAA